MPKTIRVAMIIQNYHPLVGGAERQLAALAPLLRAQAVDLYILTRRYAGLLPFELIQGTPVHRLPIARPKPLASLMFTLTALPLLKRLQPDLIHAHGMFSPATTAVAAKRLLGAPVVVKPLRGGHLGDMDRLRRKPLGLRRLRAFRQQVDAFIAISGEIDRELAGAGILPERRFFIPNGVDVDRFCPLPAVQKPAHRAALGLPAGPLVIFTGRLEAEKRIDQLIGIWPAVRAHCPEAHLLILGTGAAESRLKQMAGAGILFLGQVDNVAGYLQAADTFVLPSATEGLSNALLEAMATGLPVIATAVGAAPEVITHEQHGRLIPPDTPAALQEELLALLTNTACRHSLGRQGRQRVVEHYALPATAASLRGLYERLVRK